MSGSTIGGIVGGAIGFMVGGPIGAQVGFAIGSAVGAYVDPVQVKGPRLSDSMAQTSTVGGVIPFGYGRYLTGGNIIWCDELKEHIKRQRQGKGGGAKTTTYTYTRSYAIGVCQPIYGFHWIKRNGKKVYTTDPAATAEERAYSAKWLQKVTLYYGGEDQMPDSTIVAVEGGGNVSPFRGLAYIVVENDDLTDLQGAIPQYEFCVIASAPDVYVTSLTYPLLSEGAAQLAVVPSGGLLKTLLHERFEEESARIQVKPYTGELRDVYVKRIVSESCSFEVMPTGGMLKQVQVNGTSSPSAYSFEVVAAGGSLQAQLISASSQKNSIQTTVTPTGGALQ